MARNQEPPDEMSGLPVIRLVFSVLWNELRETIGSAPTAVLLRRAIIVSSDACSSMGVIVIKKHGRDYVYEIPQDVDEELSACDAGAFVDGVLNLLHTLTGSVLVNQMLDNPLIKRLSSKE